MPVFVNTGVRSQNVGEQLAIADGAVVGTFFKEDGRFENRAQVERVRELIGAVKEFRATM